MTGPLRVAIAGGSIGGLTAACLLREAGHAVTVYERSSTELEQRGAGIGFLEAAARYLVERAAVKLDAISISTNSIRYLDRTNEVVHSQTHAYRFSSWNTVYRRLLAAHGPEGYQLGCEVVDWKLTDAEIEIKFANGNKRFADLLICADGVGSASRKRLLPQVDARYAGYVAWRGMVPESALPEELSTRLCEAITYYVMANSHILVYPIPALNGSVLPGERLINFVWYRNYLEGGELDDVLTDANGVRRTLSVPPGLVAPHHAREAKAFAEARLPADLATVVTSVEDLFLQVVYDIAVEQMVFERICLLGDAAFVARPHAAAGTAKAAEDGWTLAAALREADTLSAALGIWERGQLSLGQALVERARSIGERSQRINNWVPGDKQFLFGLHRPGD